MKIERIYIDKEYANNYINSSIHTLPNETFISLYLNCLNINDKNVMLDNLEKLYNYSFANLDFNPQNFCLKFTKKAPFKV